METLLELVNQFGTFSITAARMGGCKATIGRAQYAQNIQMMACIGWGDSPNEALVNLYHVIKDETLHFGGKQYTLGGDNHWHQVPLGS